MNALHGRMAGPMPAGPAHTAAPASLTGRSDTPGAGSFAAVLQGTLAAVPAEKPGLPAGPTAEAGTDRDLDAIAGSGESGPGTEPCTEPGTEPHSVLNPAAHPRTALLAPSGPALAAMLSATGADVADPAATVAGDTDAEADLVSALEAAAPATGIPGAVPSAAPGAPATPAAEAPATEPAALPASAERLGAPPVLSTSPPVALSASVGAAGPGPGNPGTFRSPDSATDVTTPATLLVPAGTPAPAAAAPVAGVPAAAAAVPTHHVPLTGQVSRPLFTLVGAANGDHVMTISVRPDNLGPVTVRAHVSGDGIRVELFAPTDLARDALRAILPDLRRDLTGGGLNAQLTLSADDQASDSAAKWHDRTGAGRDREAGEIGETRPDASAGGTRPAALRAAGSHTIDVFA